MLPGTPGDVVTVSATYGMLEVLAGPYPILVDGVAPDNFFNDGGEAVTWLRGVGLYCATLAPHGESLKVCVVQMDGVAASTPIPNVLPSILLDLRAGALGLAVRDTMIWSICPLNYLVSNNDVTPFYTVPSGPDKRHSRRL